MKKITVLSAMALAFLLAACSENSVDPVQTGALTKSDIIQITSETVPAAEAPFFIDAQQEGRDEYEVFVTLKNGALVKYTYSIQGQLKEVEGLKGPFDYELNIEKDLISYANARMIALDAVKGNSESGQEYVTTWKLDKASESSRPQYRFEVQYDRMYEVRIDAATGKVIRIK